MVEQTFSDALRSNWGLVLPGYYIWEQGSDMTKLIIGMRELDQSLTVGVRLHILNLESGIRIE